VRVQSEETLELVNDEITEVLEQQRITMGRIDAKAAALVGVAAAGAQFVASKPNEWRLATAALACFAITFYFGLRAFVPRDFKTAPKPATISSPEWTRSERRVVLGVLIGTKRHAFEENAELILRRVAWLQRGVVAFAVAAAFSALSLQVGRVDGDGSTRCGAGRGGAGIERGAGRGSGRRSILAFDGGDAHSIGIRTRPPTSRGISPSPSPPRATSQGSTPSSTTPTRPASGRSKSTPASPTATSRPC
jgi:hypothetical protein